MPQHSVEHIVAVFHAEGLTDAAPHNIGLGAYCRDPREYARALKACQPEPTRLRVVTMGPPNDGPPCEGTMTCPCKQCGIDRAKRPALGAGRAQFKIRPARDRRAA